LFLLALLAGLISSVTTLTLTVLLAIALMKYVNRSKEQLRKQAVVELVDVDAPIPYVPIQKAD
jgi:hypothetical protein